MINNNYEEETQVKILGSNPSTQSSSKIQFTADELLFYSCLLSVLILLSIPPLFGHYTFDYHSYSLFLLPFTSSTSIFTSSNFLHDESSKAVANQTFTSHVYTNQSLLLNKTSDWSFVESLNGRSAARKEVLVSAYKNADKDIINPHLHSDPNFLAVNETQPPGEDIYQNETSAKEDISIPNPDLLELSSEVCLIHGHLGGGIKQDVHLYMSAFKFVKNVQHEDEMDTLGCMLCIDVGTLFLKYINRGLGCQVVALMLNSEFVNADTDFSQVDFVLMKTQRDIDLYQKYFPESPLFRDFASLNANVSFYDSIKDIKPKFMYTKHGVPVMKKKKVAKNHDIVVMRAGKSPYKNTHAVLNAWVALPELHHKKLLITCHKHCWTSSHWGVGGWLGRSKKKGIVHSPFMENDEVADLQVENITIFKTKVDGDKFDWLSNAAYHLCPSIVEGYGSYIAEARQLGAAILTTDYPPMNELVTAETGYLVPVSKNSTFRPHTFFGAEPVEAEVSHEGMMKKLKEMLSDPQEMIETKGKRARRGFMTDLQYFYRQMHALLVYARHVSGKELIQPW